MGLYMFDMLPMVGSVLIGGVNWFLLGVIVQLLLRKLAALQTLQRPVNIGETYLDAVENGEYV